jgi:NADH dehydrogenase
MRKAAVTGPLSFTGKYLTEILLQENIEVVGLTNKTLAAGARDGLGIFRYSFDDIPAMAEAMRDAEVFFNTYWVRFPKRNITYDLAVKNSIALFEAAKRAGVRRIVHTSIANADTESKFPYYKGKAKVEAALKAAGVPFAILRPTVLFGSEDILINNMAWLIRRFPIYMVAGDGKYEMQPIFVEDYAGLLRQSADSTENATVDASGPEKYSYVALVELLKEVTKRRTKVLHVPPSVVLASSKLLEPFVHDQIVTKDEIDGLMQNLLVSDEPALGRTSLRAWLHENAHQIGNAYHSEVARHYK